MSNRNLQQGFTLIEVMIAITLLAVGILAAASMQITALGGNHLAIRTTTASTLAGATIEELMSLEFEHDDLAATATIAELTAAQTDPAALELLLDTAHQPAEQPANFQIFWSVVDDYPLIDCKTIRVLVRRQDRGVLRDLALDFIKMRPLTES
ncbi:prepilin-type N-terminal cleavage/methylation domain-containing protein [Desulfurivibrio sp. C05AmB]|uniref:type IV pilus modification PilV family protein n=1 Tax=Desulfurivibrio sp. C05AmB TaxID=3374371 RepID=UPI00376EDBC8